MYGKVEWHWPTDWKPLPQFRLNYLELVSSTNHRFCFTVEKVPSNHANYCRVYVGKCGTFTALHCDPLDTTVMQVSGIFWFWRQNFAFCRFPE